MPDRRFAGTGAVLGAAALWGSTGTVAHFAPPGVSPASIGAARIVLGGAILVLVALVPGRRDGAGLSAQPAGPVPGSPRAVLGIGAVAVAGYQVCFFSAVHLTGVAIGTMIAIGSGPVFTGLISRLTGLASLSARWAIATAGAIAGCSILLAGGRTAGVNLTGAILALLAGLCYASYAVAAASLISAGSAERFVMAIIFGGGAVLLLPVLFLSSAAWLVSWRGAGVAVELGALATAAAYLLYGYGLRTVPAPVAVTLGLAEPVVATLLAIAVLGERLTGTAVAGLILVGGALTVLAVPPASAAV
jgi:DME family drug/metabolite transporter